METKDMKKDFSSIGGRMLLGALIIMALQILCQSIVIMIRPEWAENYTIMLASTLLPLYIAGYPITFLLMKKGEHRTIEKHKMSVGQLIIAGIICYGIMIVGNLIGLGVTSVISIVKGSSVDNVMVNMVSNGSLWLTAVFTVVAAPIVEELLFRKVICGKLVKYGQGVAIVVSGLMFGLFHLNFNQFFYAFLMGMFLGFIYVKTGEIKYSIIIHMAINFIGSFLSSIVMMMLDLESTTGMMIYGLYAMCLYAIAIVGVVLFFVFKSRMKLAAGEITIEKKNRFKVTILNTGMLLYCLFCLGYMVLQALI